MLRVALPCLAALFLSGCGNPTATPVDASAATEQQQLDSAAEMLDKSNKQVVDGATKPR